MTLDKGQRLKHILDIAMAPILAFDLGYGCDIYVTRKDELSVNCELAI